MSQLRLPALAAAALLGLGMALTASAQSPRPGVMKQCNIEANSRRLMGRDRQSFMRVCLSSPAKRHLALNGQQRRMQYCNAQAKARRLMGSERSRYMSSCLRAR